MRRAGILTLALGAALMLWSQSAASGGNIAGTDGWHTWQIDETGPDSRICCSSWHQGIPSQQGCNLDGGHYRYGNDGDCAAAPGQIQFYTLVKSGKPLKIMVLSSQCPVTSTTAITDHGIVSAADNITWFRHVIENRSLSQEVREEALFGLVQSESDSAYEYIDGLLTRR